VIGEHVCPVFLIGKHKVTERVLLHLCRVILFVDHKSNRILGWGVLPLLLLIDDRKYHRRLLGLELRVVLVRIKNMLHGRLGILRKGR